LLGDDALIASLAKFPSSTLNWMSVAISSRPLPMQSAAANWFRIPIRRFGPDTDSAPLETAGCHTIFAAAEHPIVAQGINDPAHVGRDFYFSGTVLPGWHPLRSLRLLVLILSQWPQLCVNDFYLLSLIRRHIEYSDGLCNAITTCNAF
jgi:hypothetical protein